MSDFPHDETLIPLGEVRKLIPSRVAGKRLNPSTIHRWMSLGIKGVILESWKVGGGRVTTVEAVRRFVQACTEPGELGRMLHQVREIRRHKEPSARQREALERARKARGF